MRLTVPPRRVRRSCDALCHVTCACVTSPVSAQATRSTQTRHSQLRRRSRCVVTLECVRGTVVRSSWAQSLSPAMRIVPPQPIVEYVCVRAPAAVRGCSHATLARGQS